MRRSTFRPSICLRISATSSSRKLLITGVNPPLGLSSPYRPPGRSSPGGGSSRGLGGAVGVSPRLCGRSPPGGGSSVGGPSSALGGADGTTPLEEAQLLRLLPVPPVPERQGRFPCFYHTPQQERQQLAA